ncbi:MAG: SDR family oxidoreductase [Smithellaceae bacterium]
MGKILITGAAGYLGAAVFEALKFHQNVVRLTGRLEDIQPASLDCDLVVHCAGALRHRTEDLQRCNVEGTRRLLEGLPPACRMIYISSKSVYRANDVESLTEDAPVAPFDAYGRSKQLGEQLVMTDGRPWIILRSGTLFGLGIENPGITFPSKAMRDFFERREVVLFDPDVIQDYLYVRDLAMLIAGFIFRKEGWNEVYNVAGPPRSLYQLIQAVADRVEKIQGHKPVIRKVSGGTPWINRLDSSKLEKVAGAIQYTDDASVIALLSEYLKRSIRPVGVKKIPFHVSKMI